MHIFLFVLKKGWGEQDDRQDDAGGGLWERDCVVSLWGCRCHRSGEQEGCGRWGGGDCHKSREGVRSSCGWPCDMAKASRSGLKPRTIQWNETFSFLSCLVGGLLLTPQGPSLTVPSSLEPLVGQSDKLLSPDYHNIIHRAVSPQLRLKAQAWSEH